MCDQPRLVVFSDVDGALRDPTAAGLDRAARALRRLTEEGAALVLCSRYTRAELELVRRQLGIDHPFIAEGGAAVFIPVGYFGREIVNARERSGHEVVEFGRPHREVVARTRAVCASMALELSGFSDMSVDEVARVSGVSPLRARLAKLCEYVEPCRPVYSRRVTRPHFARALDACRLSLVRRGDCEYVGGPVDAMSGVSLLSSLYGKAFGSTTSIGIADATADDRLFAHVDHRARVPADKGSADAVDVALWAESIVDLVRDHSRTP